MKRVWFHVSKMKGVTQSILVAMIVLFSGCVAQDGPELLGTEYRDPPEAPEFTLENQFGENVSLSDFEGKVVVVAFIYTSCPDVCLIISSNLDYLEENLGDHLDKVEIISITIDPARDTVSHLSDWTEARGYEWNHLTHERGSVIQSVWDEWNVVVDADHVANSLPPENAMVRFSVLFPDNSSLVTDNKCNDPHNLTCYNNWSEFGEYAIGTSANMNLDLDNGTIGDWSENGSWHWNLHRWDNEKETWSLVEENNLSSFGPIGPETHLAWAASNANISKLPPGVDCNSHGWVMGTGSSAHCMCDDGWERPGDNWLSCVLEEGIDSNETGLDPHEESLGEYEIGHSTVTFIIDKEQRKRVAYSGIMWNVDDFLQDVKTLADE